MAVTEITEAVQNVADAAQGLVNTSFDEAQELSSDVVSTLTAAVAALVGQVGELVKAVAK